MEQEDKVITRFDMGRMKKQAQLPGICIYEHPEDYPDKYVARLWDMMHGKPHHLIAIADTLEEIRQTVPLGLFPMPRDDRDDLCIVETWI